MNSQGLAAYQAGNYSKAIAAFRQAVALDGGDVACIINLAISYRQVEQFAQAQAVLENKAKTFPVPQQKAWQVQLADVHFVWAKKLEALSQYQLAIQHYQSAYQIDKSLRVRDAAVDLSAIGAIYSGLSRYEEALKFL